MKKVWKMLANSSQWAIELIRICFVECKWNKTKIPERYTRRTVKIIYCMWESIFKEWMLVVFYMSVRLCVCVLLPRLLPWLLSHHIECYFHLILFFSQFFIFILLHGECIQCFVYTYIDRMASKRTNGNQGKAYQHIHTRTYTHSQTKNGYCYHNAMGFFSEWAEKNKKNTRAFRNIFE